MHFCTASVRLAGDLRNVVSRGPFNPISWPEIEVLRAIHGEDAVVDIAVIAEVEQSAKAEKERLTLIYGADVIEPIFPGRNPQMELKAPGAKLPAQGVLWQSPIPGDPSQDLADPAPLPERSRTDDLKRRALSN